MSDEPKKRSRAWGWIARSGWIAIALLLLYAASMPPVMEWSDRHYPGESFDRVVPFYRPVFWAMHHSEAFHDAFDWYSGHAWGISYDADIY